MTPAVTLYPYQLAWLQDRSRFKIGMFARQTGKTFTTTLEIVDRAVEAVLRQGRERWVILSRGERQAREAMEEGIKRHLQAYRMGFEATEGEALFGDTRVTQLEVTLPGGSRITALPANPDTARGFSANVFLDEFAFHQDSHAIWRALFPVISNGYDLRVTSTPNGKGNKFYELISGLGSNSWSRHVVDIYRAVAEGLPRNIAELRAAIGDEDAWAQEFELQFLDEASAWLPYDLISACEDAGAGDPAGYQGGPCFLGVDIGRRRDLYVEYILEQVGDVLWERERKELRGATFEAQDRSLDETFARYRILRASMDQTGMGEKPVEDAQRRHGSMRVEGVLLNSPTQLRLATLAKEAFEDRRLRIQPSPALRADLHKIRKVVGATGVPRFVAERDGQGHADRAWALFLALGAAEAGGAPIEFRALGRPRASAGLGDFVGSQVA